uniref:Uncharacterized protein n=1 Tax=Strigops habroptila TaxID=2489341 RepID=A0A672U4C0_STRHB
MGSVLRLPVLCPTTHRCALDSCSVQETLCPEQDAESNTCYISNMRLLHSSLWLLNTQKIKLKVRNTLEFCKELLQETKLNAKLATPGIWRSWQMDLNSSSSFVYSVLYPEVKPYRSDLQSPGHRTHLSPTGD